MDNKNICKKCCGKMIFTIEGSIQGQKCSRCGEWGYMTTYIPEIQNDKTIYSIFLQEENPVTLEIIKTVAMISNLNFVNTKELLSETYPKIFEGSAVDTLTAAKVLKGNRIKYRIYPDFKYDIKAL